MQITRSSPFLYFYMQFFPRVQGFPSNIILVLLSAQVAVNLLRRRITTLGYSLPSLYAQITRLCQVIYVSLQLFHEFRSPPPI